MERVFVIKLIDFIFVEGIVCNVNLGLVVSGISCMILMFALAQRNYRFYSDVRVCGHNWYYYFGSMD